MEVIAHLRSPGSERTIVMWILAGEGDILAFFFGGGVNKKEEKRWGFSS